MENKDQLLKTLAIQCKGSPTSVMHQPEYKSLTKQEQIRLAKFCRIEKKLLVPEPDESGEMKDQWNEDLEKSIDELGEDDAFIKFELERSVFHRHITTEEAAGEWIGL